MRFYRMTLEGDPEAAEHYFTALTDAHDAAKAYYHKHQYGSVYIDLVEADFKHKQITNLLNGTAPKWELLMSFTMTQRGGLVKTTERP